MKSIEGYLQKTGRGNVAKRSQALQKPWRNSGGVAKMTLDEWIEELRYGDMDSIKDRLDCIELLEFLEELKRFRERGEDGI